jgi:hypothetical protein
MLCTIKLPKNLVLLNNALPKSQYEVLEEENESDHTASHKGTQEINKDKMGHVKEESEYDSEEEVKDEVVVQDIRPPEKDPLTEAKEA